MNRLAITKIKIKNKNFISYIALNGKRDFVDFELYSSGANLLNNIYIGRVQQVISNIGAVFVQISPSQKCFLPMNEAEHAIFTKKQSDKKLICEGDELLVQIEKEAVKTKDPAVSTRLTLTGTYSVLTTKNTGLNVSKKLPEEIRLSYKQLLNSLCREHEEKGYGIVLRTNSAQADEKELKADIKNLIEQYDTIIENSKHLSAYANLYKPYPEYVRRLQTVRNFTDESPDLKVCTDNTYDGIFTDIPEIKEQIETCLPYLARRGCVHLYDDRQVSLQALYNIEGNVEKLLANKVWLPSGANIIIEQLETLTVIDVNSAKNMKCAKSKSQDQVILSINKEAAKEAARQLRLRNISGMIIIDFINMEQKETEDELIAYLKNELKKDVVPCQFVDITRLGLIEITRKKVNKSLKEVVDAG